MAKHKHTTSLQGMFDFDAAPMVRDLPPLVLADAPPLALVETKCCKTCGERKPLYEFTPARLGRQGCTAHCKECVNAAYRAKHPLPEIVVALNADGNPILKNCKECGISKPLHEFHRNDACLYGRQPDCAQCVASARWALPPRPRDEPDGTKRCTQCNQAKPLAEFYPDHRGRLGVYAECKPCHGARFVPNSPDPSIDPTTTFKTCTRCNETKLLTCFSLGSKSKDGYAYSCKACDALHMRAWADLNRLRISISGKRWRAANPEKARAAKQAWQERNHERRAELRRAWVARNAEHVRRSYREFRSKNRIRDRPKRAADTARRNAMKALATPKWLNAGHWAEIEGFYFWTSVFPGHEVDHCVPLRNSLVCGLHTHLNLQVLPRRENASKSNKLIPGLERADTGCDLVLIEFCKA